MLTLQNLVELAEEHNVPLGDVQIQYAGFMGQPNDAEPDGTTIAVSGDGSAVILIGAGI